MEIGVLIILSIIFIVGFLYLSITFYFQITQKEVFVPFIPADVKGIHSMCQASCAKPGDEVIDVGSGWGSIVFYLADHFPGLKLTGIELNPVLHVIAVIRAGIFYKNKPITLVQGDAGGISYEKYDVVFLFMLSSFVNKILVPKFERELKSGAKVVSYVFKMKSELFTEQKMELPSHGWRSVVYIYTKK